MPAASRSLKELFLAALAVAPAERGAWLERECADDAELRRRVALMLAAHDAPQSLLDPPASPAEPPEGLAGAFAGAGEQHFVEARNEECGTVLAGRYKLVEEIGEGGMGTVWMAQQTEPVKRLVAVKLIKAGMDSKQVIARFEAERQALALMDHANIARVLDAGTSGAGRPYFVMDLVKGLPITCYCDEHRLTPRQRLELFLPVCRAVQHAHQKGIIHRDLKPSNVLVALYDGTPVPKVIDFGVAKAAGQSLTDKTLVTGFGAVVGTPEYMSPEQAELHNLDIDTRSDIYSLGVLLYELLTGGPPFTRQALEKPGLLEMLRVIREQEPTKPSTKLSELSSPHAPREEPNGSVTRGGTTPLASVAANRGMEPAKLTKLVRGELDWIVMKALEKDRNRRYETANGFAADVRRYLADEHVLACPPSAGYRLRKFGRRNKVGLAVTGLVVSFLVLLGGVAAWVLHDRTARRNRIEAQVDLILGEVDQREKDQKWPEALAVARRAEALTAGGVDVDAATQERIRQVLHEQRMIAWVEELCLREAPGVEPTSPIDEGRPRLYAAAFRDFGVDVEALPPGEAAARLGTRPAVALALAAALDDWARTGFQRDPEPSKRLLALATALDPDPWRAGVRQAYAARDIESLTALAEAPDTARQPPQSLILLAISLQRKQPEQAVALLERAKENHPGDFWIHFQLAWLHANRIRPLRPEAAIRHWTAARALRPRSAATWDGLGHSHSQAQKLDEAIACYRKAIELDPTFAPPHYHLGMALRRRKDLPGAIGAFREAVRLYPGTFMYLCVLGHALRDAGQLDEAIAVYRQASRALPDHPSGHQFLFEALQRGGKPDEAAAAGRELVAVWRKQIRAKPDDTAAHSSLGAALERQGELDEAIAAYQSALRLEPDFTHAQEGLANVAWRFIAGPDPKVRDPGRGHGLVKQVLARNPVPYIGVSCAPLLLLVDDLDTYRRLCPHVLATFGDTKDPRTAFFVARICTLAPDAVPGPARVVQVARRAVQAEPSPPYLHALGLAYYRAGQFDAAIEHLHKSIKGDWNANAVNWLVLAMAHHRSGRAAEARKWFDRAMQGIDNADREAASDSLGATRSLARYDSLACMVLRREAETLLGLRPQPAPAGERTPGEKK